jgi:transposase
MVIAAKEIALKPRVFSSNRSFKYSGTERAFAWIVQHRRLVRDYERSPHCASAWVFLAMIRIMINRYS